MPILCDGCNVNELWEHRCHKSNIMVAGMKTGLDCQCTEPECGPSPHPKTATIEGSHFIHDSEGRLLGVTSAD